MARRGRHLILLAAFAFTLGHVAWHALGNAPRNANYRVGGVLPALAGPDTEHRQLYLRRVFYLTQRPRHAWLQALGSDQLRVYVNGQLLAERTLDLREGRVRKTVLGNTELPGHPAAVVFDLTPYVDQGPNVIAIAAKTITTGESPRVAVQGSFVLSQEEIAFESDAQWRASTVFERGNNWWFGLGFNDRHWPAARVLNTTIEATQDSPPRARTVLSRAFWISPPAMHDQKAVIRREFDVVAGSSRQAWLRLTAAVPFRLAVNGIVLDHKEELADARAPVAPELRIYDLSSVLESGRNVVALSVTSPYSHAHVRADLEVENRAGERTYLASDETWLGHAGHDLDWLKWDVDNPSQWQPCTKAPGDLGTPPWEPDHLVVAWSLPLRVKVMRLLHQAAWIVGLGLITWILCNVMTFFLAIVQGHGRYATALATVYLTLLPPTLATGIALLATYDPRVAWGDVYSPWWVIVALLSLPLQWALLLTMTPTGIEDEEPALASAFPPLGSSRWLIVVLLLGVIVLGGWLRYRNLTVGPLVHDESTVYRATQGFLERGFPSRQAHPDLPVQYVQTSELVYLGTAATACFLDDPRMIVRLPAFLFSLATIPLIYFVGQRLFSGGVGLLAATLYAVSPHCIEVANFGRYLAQLQFFTLLTVYCFWRTLRGHGPLNNRALWATTFGFLAMYLSWEGSALIAVGMILAALVQRRGRVGPILWNFHTWLALCIVILIVVLQSSHRTLQLTQMLRYGTGAQEAGLKAMWSYPDFEAFYYIWNLSWSRDTLLPMLGLLGACMLVARHAWKRQARFLLLIMLATCFLMAAFLSLKAWRYSYHLIPFLMILVSAGLVAGARILVLHRRKWEAPLGWRLVSQGAAVGAIIAFIIAGNGWTFQLTGMTSFRITGLYELPLQYAGLKPVMFSDYSAGAQVLTERLEKGDVVMCDRPHLLGMFMDRPADFFPQSKLYVQAVLDDKRSLPLHHYGASVFLPTLESLEDVFARHGRIWYVARPKNHASMNHEEISAFLRQHMEVVYEDVSLIVMCRDGRHRPAELRQAEEKLLLENRTNFLR